VGRALACVLVIVAAMVAQVTVVDRLPLPGGGGLDLLLLAVVALSLVRGASAGALIGFCVGLAVDILPPADHAIGQYAMVMCLIGYMAGRARERAPGALLVTAAACVVVAPLLAAGLSALLGDPRMDETVLTQMWPPVAVYNLLAVPLVVWAVNRATGHGRLGALPLRVWRRA
jgi:rod shape-determining protein MreD